MRRKHLAALAAASIATGATIGTAVAADPPPQAPSAAQSAAVSVQTLRAAATQFAASLPSPAGATLNGIQWTPGSPSPAIDPGARFVVTYNVLCQWVRALEDGRQVADARSALAAAPGWPAFAGTEALGNVTRATQQGLAGGGADWSVLSQECREAGQREAAFAQASGLPPTR